MRQIAVFIALALLATAASAQIYKWVDQDGKVQYSSTPPPPGAKQEKTLTTPRPSSPAPAAASKSKSGADLEAEFRKRQLDQSETRGKQEREAADEKQRQAQCASARSNLTQLESGVRISKFDAAGERTYLEDEDRPAAIAEARKAVDSWCTPQAAQR